MHVFGEVGCVQCFQCLPDTCTVHKTVCTTEREWTTLTAALELSSYVHYTPKEGFHGRNIPHKIPTLWFTDSAALKSSLPLCQASMATTQHPHTIHVLSHRGKQNHTARALYNRVNMYQSAPIHNLQNSTTRGSYSRFMKSKKTNFFTE